MARRRVERDTEVPGRAGESAERWPAVGVTVGSSQGGLGSSLNPVSRLSNDFYNCEFDSAPPPAWCEASPQMACAPETV